MFVEYTIRTETTVRTSEIKFVLGEVFPEATVDGRITQTMPTLEGNVLTLDQVGDPSKQEKSTKMVREFTHQHDTSSNNNPKHDDGPFDFMLLTMEVDSVICKRVYTRIPDEGE